MIERYTRPRMAQLWSAENRFQKWLEVELLACEAWAKLGVIPADAVEELKARAFTVDEAFVRRVAEIEATTRHDVIAFTQAVAERIGHPAARYIHYGLTSTDVVDTALSAVLNEAVQEVQKGLDGLIAALGRQAVRYKDTLIMGRTHGVHAEPTSFGLKLAVFYAQFKRDSARLEQARQSIAVGKLSGAVGNYGNIDPFVEQYVCEKLGLAPADISTQVLQRDRHAHLLTTLAILGSSLDSLAIELRLLQKTETREVEEPFSPGQKGSSAMPHKRNPVTLEQISGLSRILRANAVAALENVPLWHERDISHSSVERVILPDSTILADYLLARMTWVVENMHVYPENMKRSMQASYGLTSSGSVLLALVEKGLSREQAYAIVQERAMQAWSEGIHLRRLLEQDPTVQSLLTPAELDAAFDLRHHLRHVDTIMKRLGLIE
ncbi:MAG: adenylosuccinate lyase [Symbiobacterium sp.]|uniref:adenylosuccinate lyase n=1 Tax=Symbiobacterium sp. TaxID=1971213 RepID=UPI003463AD46